MDGQRAPRIPGRCCRDGLYAAFFLAAHTGMRRGEVLGLRWADLDLDGSRVSVNQAIISVAYCLKVSDVKTGTGRRTINLDARTVGVLQAWRKAVLAERLLLGPAFVDNDLVFAQPDGIPIHPQAFSQAFDRAVARLGLPVITLHDYADLRVMPTLMAMALRDKAIAA